MTMKQLMACVKEIERRQLIERTKIYQALREHGYIRTDSKDHRNRIL